MSIRRSVHDLSHDLSSLDPELKTGIYAQAGEITWKTQFPAGDMHAARIYLEQIEIPEDRLWETDQSNVDKIAESILSDGQVVPIGVQLVLDLKSPDPDPTPKFKLVYGLHRYLAMKKLWETQEKKGRYEGLFAVVFSPFETQAAIKRYETIENLIRRQLTDEEEQRFQKILTPQLKKLKKVLNTIGEEGLRKAEEKANINVEKNINKQGNASKPNVAKAIAEAYIDATQPDLKGEKREKRIKSEGENLSNAFKDAKAQVGLDKETKLSADSILMAHNTAKAAVFDESIAKKISKTAKDQVDNSKAKRTTKAQAAQTVEKAIESGRDDLAEKIESSEDADKKKVVVEVRKELGMPSNQTSCKIELHWPAEDICKKMVKNFNRETIRKIHTWLGLWLKQNDTEKGVQS